MRKSHLLAGTAGTAPGEGSNSFRLRSCRVKDIDGGSPFKFLALVGALQFFQPLNHIYAVLGISDGTGALVEGRPQNTGRRIEIAHVAE